MKSDAYIHSLLLAAAVVAMAAEPATAIEQKGTHPAAVAAVPPELSAAHQRSKFANIDPVYDATYGFYGRPFGKSLCHAWGAGPVVLLPRMILGLHPTQDGLRHFTVAPRLGELKWACATVPTPQGNIEVEGEGGRIKLSVPPGTTALYEGKTYTGPVEIKEELK